MIIRYFYYVIFVNMLMSVVIFVPKILFDYQDTGTLTSMLLSLPSSALLMMVFVKAMSKFPQKGLPEILSDFPLWVKSSLLLLTGLTWFVAGMITLMAYTDLAVRFINPDMDEWLIKILFVLAVSFVSQFRSDKILYMVEIALILNVPLIGLIIFGGIRSHYMNWGLVMEGATHFGTPSLSALAAATYGFTGYLNFVIFNRVFPKPLKVRWLWAVLGIVFLSLLNTYFMPIGYHGTYGVADYVFPWITTADSIRMEFGPIERMVFIFFLLYLSISLVSAVIHWHVGKEMIREVFPQKKEKTWLSWLILISFSLATILLEVRITETGLFEIAEKWLVIRLLLEISLVLLLFALSRRVKE